MNVVAAGGVAPPVALAATARTERVATTRVSYHGVVHHAHGIRPPRCRRRVARRAASPPMPEPHEVTRLLSDARAGVADAKDRLFERVYDELKQLAKGQLRRQRDGESWHPTALVHEAFVRMVDPTRLDLHDRAHFYAVAVTVMRRVLVDHYRRRTAGKRRGGAQVTLHEPLAHGGAADVDILALDDALRDLAAMDERKARVVELRFFGGLSVDDVATALDVSKRTVESDWFFARAWLQTRLHAPEA
ncbi:MAG: ECF-type sigma factor [Planctomycetota bacterium]